MTAEDKQIYQEKAALERARVAQELEAWKAAGGQDAAEPSPKNTNTSGALIFPVARIRKICKLDPEVRGLSKEAVLLVTKAAEMATSKLGMETVRVAQIQNRRKLLPEDVAQVCSSREQFLFLREDVADFAKQTAVAAANAAGTPKAAKTKADQVDVSNIKPLTSYFAAKPKS